MKSYHTLSWKEIKTQKITSILILIAIVLSTMMTTVIGQSLGILQALREQQAGMLNGYRYATFHNLTEQQKALVESDSHLSWAGSNITLGTAKLQNSGIYLQVKEYDKYNLSAYPLISQLKSGRLPKAANEISLSEDTLKLLGFSGDIGDTITLDLSISLLRDTEIPYEYQAEFELCGILENNYLGYSSGIVNGIVGQGSAKKLLPEKYLVYSTDFRMIDKHNFQQNVDDLAKKAEINDDHIQYNWLYLNALNISYRSENNSSENSGFSFMVVASVIIGVLVLIAAGLVIYNILKIAVSKRIREYGVLRAIGAKKGQLYRLVSEQIIILCGVGIPLGAVLGVLSASGITKAATSMFSPSIFMAQNTEELATLIAQNSTGKIIPLIISVAITLIFAFVAAMPAARYAAKVSPTVAMSGKTVKVNRKNRKDKKIRHFEAFYAQLNLKRNAARTAITILSLVMSITVFVALSAFSGLLDSSKDVQKLHLGDYAITNETIGFAPSAIDTLKKQEDVAALSTLKYKIYFQSENGTLEIQTDFVLRQSHETLQIIGIDTGRLTELFPEITEAQKQAFIAGKACLTKNPVSIATQGETLEATYFGAGDYLSIADHSFDVLGNCDAVTLTGGGYTNGVQIIVYDTVFDELTGETNYTELYPTLVDGADTASFEQAIEVLCEQTPDSRWISYQNTDKQLEESYQQIKLLAWGLIFFIGLIGLLNIINTTYTNIHTRIAEIGMQRAIGMSSASLYKTFLWEGAYYGLIASVVGAITGYICSIFIGAAATEQLAFVAVPIIPIIQATFASVIACLIATCIPLRQIARMSIVDSIGAVE